MGKKDRERAVDNLFRVIKKFHIKFTVSNKGRLESSILVFLIQKHTIIVDRTTDHKLFTTQL